MQDLANQFLGVRTATLVAAFFGSMLSLSYLPELGRWKLFTSLVAGTAVAVYGAPLLTHYSHLPDVLERAIAFFAGLLAMRAIPVMFAMVEKLKDLSPANLFGKKE